MNYRSVPYKFNINPGPTDAVAARPVPPEFLSADPGKAPLQISASDVNRHTEELRGVRNRINVPIGLLARGVQRSVLVSPYINSVSQTMGQAIGRLPEVASAAGVDAATLTATAGKLVGMTLFYATAEVGNQRFDLGRRITASVLRKLSDQMVDTARYLLGLPDLKPELRTRITTWLSPIEREDAKQAEAAKGRRDAAKSETGKSQAELDRLHAQEVLRQVLDDLAAGRTPDPLLAAQAVATQEELEQEAEAAAAAAGSPAAGKTKGKGKATPPVTSPGVPAPVKAGDRRGGGR